MKDKTTYNDFINYWLKWHDTTIEEQLELHPEWKEDSRAFYEAFPVSQAQHDQWYEWAIQTLMKEYKMGKKQTKRSFFLAYLNLAPMVKT